MHILVTGGTGFIGQALVPRLVAAGHEVTVVTRSPLRQRSQAGVHYVPAIDDVAGADALINLAGASLAGRRWNRSYKDELRSSRIGSTERVAAWCRSRRQPPSVVLSGSAVGYYGPRDDERLDEGADSGTSFSAQLCRDWEAAAAEAQSDATRVCLLRLGVVFDRQGGAFADLVKPFRFGIANWLGSGRQWLSWIHRRDVVSAMLFLLEHNGAAGPYNLTAPGSVTSRGLCTALRQHFHTLPAMPVPGPVMRILLGEVADELLLTGQQVEPMRLTEAGFAFTYPTLETALPQLLGRPG